MVKTEAKGAALRRALKITFKGEAGVDEGGILSEVSIAWAAYWTVIFQAVRS